MSESLRTVVLQELKARFPGMTWKLGSLVRTLIVEPLAALGDAFDSYIQKAENGLNVVAICQSPSQYSEELDTWMNRLGIAQPELRAASGMVALLSDTGEDMTIDSGTMFTWGDELSFQVTESRTFGSGSPYTKLSEGAYLAEVPVESVGATGASLSIGSPLNWEGAPSHIYDIYTASPISGGRSILTDQAKATLIMSALSPNSFTGEACISKALQREFPNDIIDAKAGAKDAEKLYKVNLFVKPSNPPSTFTRAASTYTDEADNSIKAQISGAGVITVDKVVDKLSATCPIVATTVTGNLGDSDSIITLTLSSVRAGEGVTAYFTGFQIVQDVAYWLNAEQQGMPFSYTVKIPAVVTIGIAVSTTEALPINVRNDLQDYINDKPLDSAVTDSEVAAILQRANITMTSSNVYTAAVLNSKNTVSLSTSVGGVSPAGNAFSFGRPTAMYSYVNKIFANVQ